MVAGNQVSVELSLKTTTNMKFTREELQERAKTQAWRGKIDCRDCENGQEQEKRLKAGETGWLKCQNCGRGYFVSEEVPENPYPNSLPQEIVEQDREKYRYKVK